MTDLVFDVTFAHGKTQYYVRGLTGAEAAVYKRHILGVAITPRKLLPCAQRRANDARIATPSPAGPSPATGRGGDL